MSGIRWKAYVYLNIHGETATVRRVTGSTRTGTAITHTTTDTVIKAKFYTKKESDQSGLVSQGMVNVKISAQALGFRPKPDDKIIRGSETYLIASVDARVDAGVDVLYIVTAKGI